MIKTTVLFCLVIFLINYSHSAKVAVTVEELPSEFVEYESKNVYGTISEKERQYGIKNGIRPLVDTIYEHEKYGNDGGKIRHIGSSILRGTEGFSAYLGTKFEGAQDQQQYALQGLTQSLNSLGRKLIGLA